MSEKMRDALVVDFKMRRQRKRIHESGPDNKFWTQVTATPQRSDIRDIDIKMYQTSGEQDLRYLYPRLPLMPYTMRNGYAYTWRFDDGDVVAIIVRYTLKTDKNCWFVAASGIWLCDGQYFMSGARLKDTSELFNDTIYLQFGDNTARDEQTEQMIEQMIASLPSSYPTSKLTRNEDGWMLIIGDTVIFHGVDDENAKERTRRYVRERENAPDLPVGVIGGIYD